LNFELSFKIILIQKSQVYFFRESSNFVEFENIFDLNLNFEFKFKAAAKFEKQFYFSFTAQLQFRPIKSSGLSSFLFSFSLNRPTNSSAHSTSTAQFGPLPFFLPPSVSSAVAAFGAAFGLCAPLRLHLPRTGSEALSCNTPESTITPGCY
jgi:hypothetical protein